MNNVYNRCVKTLLFRRSAPLAYVLPALALYAPFVLWPLGRVLALSLVRWDGISPAVPVGLANYAALWADPGFADEVSHSAVWLAVTLAAPVVAGLALALLLDAAPARLRAPARALLIVPLVLPVVVIAVAWRLVYNPLSGPLTSALDAVGLSTLAGDYLGDPNLALGALLVPACWAAFGLSLLVFGAALRGISPEVVAAAQVDGAGALARLRHVTLPALRGALPLATVVTALSAVPSLDLILLTTNGGPGYATTTLTLDMYGRAFGAGNGQVGVAAALAALQAVVGLALALLALGVARGQERAGDDGGMFGARPRVFARRVPLGSHVRLPIGRLVASAVVLAVTFVTLFPLLWLVVLAVRPSAASPNATPWAALGDNLGAVWARDFGTAFLTSAIVAATVAIAVVLLALPAAFALATTRSRAACLLAGALLALGLFQPEAILIIPLFHLLIDFHLLTSPLGLVLPETTRTLPFAVLLLWGALRGLPADVTAAAAVDGAAPRQILWRIAAPLAWPMIAVAALWAFLSSWHEYLLPVVVLQDDTLQTVPAALGHFVGSVATLYGLLAAGALLAVLPLLILYGLLYGAVAAGLRRLRPSER